MKIYLIIGLIYGIWNIIANTMVGTFKEKRSILGWIGVYFLLALSFIIWPYGLFYGFYVGWKES